MFTKCFFLLQKCFFFFCKMSIFLAKNVLFLFWKGTFLSAFFCQRPLRSLMLQNVCFLGFTEYGAFGCKWLQKMPAYTVFAEKPQCRTLDASMDLNLDSTVYMLINIEFQQLPIVVPGIFCTYVMLCMVKMSDIISFSCKMKLLSHVTQNMRIF